MHRFETGVLKNSGQGSVVSAATAGAQKAQRKAAKYAKKFKLSHYFFPRELSFLQKEAGIRAGLLAADSGRAGLLS